MSLIVWSETPPHGASPARFMMSSIVKHRIMPLEPAFLVAEFLHPPPCAPRKPLAPRRYSLETYNDVAGNVRNTRGYISVLIDDAARERAEDSHRILTNLVAGKIRDSGAIPKSNRYVDLSAVLNDNLYLFEMKSTTNDNVHAQIRRAISQLYEYRYLQQVPDAKLVVVIETPPPQEKRWIVDYVVKDRQLLIAWDGDRRNLHCPIEVARELRFLTQ
jgi:hypothetical protein